jgi:hypothetical protein
MKKYLILLLFLCSCSVSKHIEKTHTVIQSKIDTVITFHFELPKPKYVTVKITDTAIVENETAIAKSYFNPITQKIVLELKGKEFKAPIKINRIETTDKKEVDIQTINKAYKFMTIIIALLLIATILIYILKKYIK